MVSQCKRPKGIPNQEISSVSSSLRRAGDLGLHVEWSVDDDCTHVRCSDWVVFNVWSYADVLG